MNNKFILINKERELLIYIEKYFFSSLPKSEKHIKDKLYEQLFLLIENTLSFNHNKGNIRKKYINSTKINISMIDFLINALYEKDIIKKRRLLSAIRILSEVKNIVYGIDENEKE